jgi:hypothetical protein
MEWKVNMKTIRFIIPIVLSALLLASCSSKNTNVRDDVAVSDIAAAVDTRLEAENFASMNESYLKGAMKLDTSLFKEYEVKINAFGANIDEYGIFKAADNTGIKDVEKAVRDYLQMRLDTWMEEYMPEEKPKLEAAETVTMGSYVMYAILSEENKANVFEEFKSMLTPPVKQTS